MKIQTSKAKSLWVAFISDVHLGHRTTKTRHILNNLDIAFPDNAETAKLDVIFINGDFFDRQLQLSDPAVNEITHWVSKFLRLCKRLNIKLRVLEGTPLHDWKQSEIFVTQNETGNIGCDLIYHKALDIEFMEDLGISVLYIPDEWKSGPDDAKRDVVAKLAEYNLQRVDYAMIHGFFPHQLPEMAVGAHDPVFYESIVRCAISIGHVHHQSQSGKIFAQGSFDRLGHGYETDKGHYRIYDTRGEGVAEAIFVVNKGAKVYRTIDCRGLDHEGVYKRLEAEPDYPVDSYIRLHCRKDDAVVSALGVIKKKYSQYAWSPPKIDKDHYTAKEIVAMVSTRFEPITLTNANAVEILSKRIGAKTTDHHLLNRAIHLLKEATDNGINRTTDSRATA